MQCRKQQRQRRRQQRRQRHARWFVVMDSCGQRRAERDGSSAWRRRQRRLRAAWRHEQLSIAMAWQQPSTTLRKKSAGPCRTTFNGTRTLPGRGRSTTRCLRTPMWWVVASRRLFIENFVPVQTLDGPVPQSSMDGVQDQILQRTAELVLKDPP